MKVVRCLLVFLWLSGSVPVPGASVEVCSEADLRTAVSGGGTVTFGCDGVIELSTPIQVFTNTVLDGSGRNVMISGGGKVRLFEVAPEVSFELRNVAIVNGFKLGAAASVSQAGQTNAESVFGGGIAATNAHITISGCIVSNNVAKGGAPFLDPPVSLPAGGSRGGAIFMNSGTLRLIDSSFLANSALGGYGTYREFDSQGTSQGGAVATTNCEVRVINSIFARNQASTPGGGAMDIENGSVEVTECEFEDNFAAGVSANRWSGHAAGDARGGALRIAGAPISITNSTFRRNALLGGGGYFSPSQAFEGGAIFTDGNLTVRGALFERNLVQGAMHMYPVLRSAGGAVQADGNTRIEATRFIANTVIGPDAGNVAGGSTPQAGSAFGGGISLAGDGTLLSSSFISNRVVGGVLMSLVDLRSQGAAAGAAIWSGSNLFGTNLTIGFNESRVWEAGTLRAAVHVESPYVVLSYSTLATNWVTFVRGGGQTPATDISQATQISIETNRTLRLHGSILSGGISNLVAGTLVDAGFNISSDSSLSNATSRNATDANLGVVGQYGSQIETLPLLEGSPAIDRGDTSDFPVTDARGMGRPIGSGPDIGAFEHGVPEARGSLSVEMPEAGRLRIHGMDEAGRPWVLERSEALEGWSPVFTNSAGSEAFQYDPRLERASGFYRLRLPSTNPGS